MVDSWNCFRGQVAGTSEQSANRIFEDIPVFEQRKVNEARQSCGGSASVNKRRIWYLRTSRVGISVRKNERRALAPAQRPGKASLLSMATPTAHPAPTISTMVYEYCDSAPLHDGLYIVHSYNYNFSRQGVIRTSG